MTSAPAKCFSIEYVMANRVEETAENLLVKDNLLDHRLVGSVTSAPALRFVWRTLRAALVAMRDATHPTGISGLRYGLAQSQTARVADSHIFEEAPGEAS